MNQCPTTFVISYSRHGKRKFIHGLQGSEVTTDSAETVQFYASLKYKLVDFKSYKVTRILQFELQTFETPKC